MAKKKSAKPPREATTLSHLCAMPCDNVDFGDYWIVVDETTVSLAEQALGHVPVGKVTLPRATFDAFVDWYNTGVWRKPRRSLKKRNNDARP